MHQIQVGLSLCQVGILEHNVNMLFLVDMLVTPINQRAEWNLFRVLMNIGKMESLLIISVLL